MYLLTGFFVFVFIAISGICICQYIQLLCIYVLLFQEFVLPNIFGIFVFIAISEVCIGQHLRLLCIYCYFRNFVFANFSGFFVFIAILGTHIWKILWLLCIYCYFRKLYLPISLASSYFLLFQEFVFANFSGFFVCIDIEICIRQHLRIFIFIAI